MFLEQVHENFLEKLLQFSYKKSVSWRRTAVANMNWVIGAVAMYIKGENHDFSIFSLLKH